MKNLSIIILAAGKGTRMKSDLPKVMHKIAHREMLNMVIDEAKKLNPQEITIVISDEMEKFFEEIFIQHPEMKINFVLQQERLGTAHAVKIAIGQIDEIGDECLILYGDTPLVSHHTLKMMLDKLNNFSLCILGFEAESHSAYGRLVVDINGHLEKIVEYKDASHAEKEIKLCNSGVMAVNGDVITRLITQIQNNNAAKEFYLTDLIALVNQEKLKCTFIHTDEEEVLGVNSRAELARLETIKQNQLRKKMMDSGVTLLDPASVYFSFDTKISHDVLIHPHVFFGKNVSIHKDVEIKSFCHIDGAEIASDVVIGPFARIRPETKIASRVRIGNFVEIKKSTLKRGAKVNHLSYIGDAEIGCDSNIGAGTITCNYDGYNKFNTKIGDNVFVGSNSALIAPIDIGSGAVIAAGSVITKNVIKDELAVSRAKQIAILDGGKTFHSNKSKEKK
jgi:bifunctional UDP-N-acetylglucosamine pyrophosphorylase/glucosamine-1-phosphate N-acetyltransferase